MAGRCGGQSSVRWNGDPCFYNTTVPTKRQDQITSEGHGIRRAEGESFSTSTTPTSYHQNKFRGVRGDLRKNGRDRSASAIVLLRSTATEAVSDMIDNFHRGMTYTTTA